MTDFLLELRSEEIPARMQAKARDDLAKLFVEKIGGFGLVATEIKTFATPRRLALIACGLPDKTNPVHIETKGPKVGAPVQALEGFMRRYGVAQCDLIEREGTYFLERVVPGQPTAEVLSETLRRVVLDFPWPKSQRWGAASASTESLRWVRPLSGIIALLGDELVPFEVDGIASGSVTMGHRFHHSGEIAISNAADYAAKLRAAHVIVDQDERQDIIRRGAERAAADAGLALVPDEGLVIENAGLTEWPVPLLGRFDATFLDLPPEVIQLTARVNQKYFVCKAPLPPAGGAGGGSLPSASESSPAAHPTPNPSRKREGDLANAFVCTANIDASDGGAAIVAGNEKVLAARLSDAKFFWEQDLKLPLETQAEKLSSIVFHEKLGTVADKVDRVAKLARWLVEQGIVTPLPPAGGAGGGPAESSTLASLEPTPNPSRKREGDIAALADVSQLADDAERAARLCKADLVTGMVGEFPELQGIMGGYYARAQGEADAVADAIRDHYKPAGQGDDVPTAPVTVAVSLADKLDTLLAYFAISEVPTGSKDPYALRRAALGFLRIVTENGLRVEIRHASRMTISYIAAIRLSIKTEAIRSELGSAFVQMGSSLVEARDEMLRQVNEPDHESPWVEDIAKSTYEAFAGAEKLIVFFADRLKVQQREAGVRHDLIDAVFAAKNQKGAGEDDLVRLLARVHALQAFVATGEGANLLAGYKRAANILKAADGKSPLPLAGGAGAGSVESSTLASLEPTPNPSRKREGDISDPEQALLTALDTAEPRAAAAIGAEDFAGAMAALASLRAPIDAFFDGVMVNDPDPDKRAFRLGLLARFRGAVHKVADFSKIEG